MKWDNIHNLYFLGIGGIGMSALALYFIQKGMKVSGYDKTRTALTDFLEEKGALISYVDAIDEIPSDVELVVYTPAVPKNHTAWEYFEKKDIPILKRSEVLGILSSGYKTIGVAGTHGKTTISTMIAHILNQSNIKCNAFLGGLSKNFSSNLLMDSNSSWMVVEADEYDRSFLTLNPWFSVVSSTDPDHLDIYGSKEKMRESFVQYLAQTQKNGASFVKYGLDLAEKADYTYHVSDARADYHARHICVENGEYIFDFVSKEITLGALRMSYPGLHNVENAIVAVAVCLHCGVDIVQIREALHSFQGVKRRFERVFTNEKIVYIDDYAHHPTEINACLHSAREMYPNKKITVIFQPHLYSRTRDFADLFIESLQKADELILLDIYPARELPIEGVSSEMLKEKIKNIPVRVCGKEDMLSLLPSIQADCLITMGAGDIDALVKPIAQFFRKC